MMENEEADKMEGEISTLYHVIKMKKRRATSTIQMVKDEEGHEHKSPESITRIFLTQLRRKYDSIAFDEESIATLISACPKVSQRSNMD
jgi:predicted transcriptional regulator